MSSLPRDNVPSNCPRALIYLRVSTTSQEEDGSSLETQAARCRAYCEEHGYTIAAVYREAYSGFDLHRPQLTLLRDAIRNRAGDVVVCYAIDRLSRNQTHLAIILYDLDGTDTRLEFVTEQFEDSAVGKFIMSAKSFAAELEREKILERTTRGKMARVQSGKLPGHGPAPYGYQWNADRSALEIDPITAATARRIFTEMANGTTIGQIVDGLRRDGIPTPGRSQYWVRATVRTILKNPVYMGTAQANRWYARKQRGKVTMYERPEHERIKLPDGVAPPIVDEATWQAAQARLEYNRTTVRRQPSKPEAHLLRGGFLICGHCNGLMTPSWMHGNPIYKCSRHRHHPWECGNGHSIAGRLVDTNVWQRVAAALKDPDLIARQLAAQRETPDQAERDLAVTQKALAEVDRQSANLVANLALVTGHAATLIAGQLNTLEKQRARLEGEHQEAATRAEARKATLARLDNLTRICAQVAARLRTFSYAEKRLALTALGVQVKCYDRTHEPRYTVTSTIDLNGTADGVLLDKSSPLAARFLGDRAHFAVMHAGDEAPGRREPVDAKLDTLGAFGVHDCAKLADRAANGGCLEAQEVVDARMTHEAAGQPERPVGAIGSTPKI